MRTSTIYTIGTALMRAQGTDLGVDLLVTGQWMHGHVSAVDAHGVVLLGDDDVLSVLRMESIDAVQVRQGSAFEQRPEVEAHQGGAAHPMPAAPTDQSWTEPTGIRYKYGPDANFPEPSVPVPVPVPASGVPVPVPRRAERPPVGPITAPYAVPDAGLHTMLRPLRATVAEATAS